MHLFDKCHSFTRAREVMASGYYPYFVPIEGSNYITEVDTVVCAIGQSPNPLIPQTAPDLKIGKWGNIEADEKTGKTSKKGCWAGGDVVRGGATVILAMGDARVAARSIDEYLKTGVW